MDPPPDPTAALEEACPGVDQKAPAVDIAGASGGEERLLRDAP
jgi:hypothetical protein